MPVPQLNVHLQEFLVGTITNVSGDLNIFAFDEDYRRNPDAPTLSFKAFRNPITGQYRNPKPTTRALPPYFANLLPEGALRRYLAQHARVNETRDFPLIWLLGRDLPGALVVTDADARSLPPQENPSRRRSEEDIESLLRFSLAGVQLKFSAVGDPNRGLTIPVEGMGGYWIVKLPDQRFANVPENEFSMLTFAREVGIDVPEIGLIEPEKISGLPRDIRLKGKAFFIRRFDRGASGARIHTEDFAQANGAYPTDQGKYNTLNFEGLARQIAGFSGIDGAIDFVQRLIFTFAIGNADMHIKNWSVIYRDGKTPTLAPAYDYVSTIVYIPRDDININLVGSKSFKDVDWDRIAAVADRALLPRRPIIRAAEEMVQRVRDIWPKLSRELPLSAVTRREITDHMNRLPLFQSKAPAHAPRPEDRGKRRTLRRPKRKTA